MINGTIYARYADDQTLAYIAKLEAELAEWKLRAMTAELMVQAHAICAGIEQAVQQVEAE